MSLFVFIVIFLGCLILTSGLHIYMAFKLEKIRDKHFLQSEEGYREMNICIINSGGTMFILFIATFILTITIMLKYTNFVIWGF